MADAVRPFAVPVAALRKSTGATRRVSLEGAFDDLAALGVAVPAGEPVRVTLSLSSYPGGIVAAGRAVTRWSGECRRCGGVVRGALDVEVHERFAPDGGSPANEDAYPLVGDELDLEPMVHDSLLLDLPLAPLCRVECQGLCPVCGVNRNQHSCSCAPPPDPRWAALDALRDR